MCFCSSAEDTHTLLVFMCLHRPWCVYSEQTCVWFIFTWRSVCLSWEDDRNDQMCCTDWSLIEPQVFCVFKSFINLHNWPQTWGYGFDSPEVMLVMTHTLIIVTLLRFMDLSSCTHTQDVNLWPSDLVKDKCLTPSVVWDGQRERAKASLITDTTSLISDLLLHAAGEHTHTPIVSLKDKHTPQVLL